MKITRREGEDTGGRFAVSVSARQVDRIESALTFLEDEEALPASQIILELILSAAREKGWRPAATERAELPTDAS
jgi:hypothetical protein